MTSVLGWCVVWLSVILLWIRYRDASLSAVRWACGVLVSISAFRATCLSFLRMWPHALDASALHRVWLMVQADDGGPSWLDTRGPPVASASPWVSTTAAGHAGSSKERQRAFLPGNSWLDWAQRKTRVLQQPLASR